MKDKHFTKFLKDISKELKDVKPVISEAVQSISIEPIVEETTAERVAKYLSTSQKRAQKRDDSIPAKSGDLIQKSTVVDSIPAKPENIENQRWDDPLRKEPAEKFVTFKEMNDHYSLFLNRIQQQMGTMSGGGEVRFSRLDDVNTTGATDNTFLSYNANTNKFVFDSVDAATDTTLGTIIPGPAFNMDGDILRLNTGDSLTVSNNALILLAGSSTRIGGVKSGNGVIIAPDGTINIDSEGLSFSFGDFYATSIPDPEGSANTAALLSSVNENEGIVIATNGTGAVEIVGEFHIHRTDGTVSAALEVLPIFSVLSDGQVQLLVPAADQLSGALEIVGNDSGIFHPPNQTGVILHTTGNTNTPNRVYHDSINSYPIIVGRRYNGDLGALEAVANNDIIFRIAGQASTGSDFEPFGPAKINWIATEDQGPNNQGGKITIDVTANGTSAFGNVLTPAEFTENGIIAALGITGDLTGNADTVTNGIYTTDTGTVTNTMLANSTISGISLGSNLAALTAGSYVTSAGTYTGATARTFAVDATTTNTASKVVARDSNGTIAATNTTLATRQAGSFGSGQTLTINMATDKYVHANITGETVTVAYTNITPGKEIYIFFTNATGGDLAVNSGVSDQNATNAKAVENTKHGGTSQIRITSLGTTVNDLYVHFKK